MRRRLSIAQHRRRTITPGERATSWVYAYIVPRLRVLKLGVTIDLARREQELRRCDPDLIWLGGEIQSRQGYRLGKYLIYRKAANSRRVHYA